MGSQRAGAYRVTEQQQQYQCIPQIFVEFVVQLLSRVQFFVTLWTTARQAPLSIKFTRQEYRSGLPFPSPGGLPAPEIEPVSLALAGGFFTTEPPGKPL